MGKSRVDMVSHHYKMGPKGAKQGQLEGDSPELCRTLDSHGSTDLDTAVAFQCALASAGTSPAGEALRAFLEHGERGCALGVHG
jgi:hypothetical protein